MQFHHIFQFSNKMHIVFSRGKAALYILHARQPTACIFFVCKGYYTPPKNVWCGSFLAVNHHNHENWVPSILIHNLWLIFIGMMQKKIFFGSSQWKLVTNYVLESMGLNFHDYDGLQPKITPPKHFSRQCNTLALPFLLFW